MNIFSFTLPDAGDRSVTILDQITGVTVQMITGEEHAYTTTTFTKMLFHFNTALLGFGLIIFAILLFVGTMNTAADGQFLGRNWNSVWTPVRIILGILFVVPLKTGLCVGQYIFLYLILVGVTIATTVWDQVLDDVFNHYTPPAMPSYLLNYAQQAVEADMVLSATREIEKKVFSQGGSETVSGCPAAITANSENLTVLKMGYAFLNANYDTATSIDNAKQSTSLYNKYYNNNDGFVNTNSLGGWDIPVDRAWNKYIAYRAAGNPKITSDDFTTVDPQCFGHQNTVTSTINTDVMYDSTNIPASVLFAIQGGTANICRNLYSNSDVIKDCQNAITQTIRSGTSGTETRGTNSNLGFVKVWAGQNMPASVITDNNNSIMANPEAWTPSESNIKNGADGKIHVEGTYHYSFSLDDSSNTDTTNPVAKTLQDSMREQLTGPTGLVTTKVMDVSQPGKDLCANGGCSLAAMSNTLVNAAQTEVSMNLDQCKEVTDKSGQTVTDMYGNVIFECPALPNLYNYTINGMPYTKADGSIAYQQVSIPLKGSWWNAGESYLILDDHFAQNLKILVDAVQNMIPNLLGQNSLTGSQTISFDLMVQEYGAVYKSGMNWAAQHNGQYTEFFNSCYPLSQTLNGPSLNSNENYFVCGTDTMRLFRKAPIQLVNEKISLADLGATGSWAGAIAPYDPNPATEVAHHVPAQNTSEIFYNELASVPITMQAPLQMLLTQADTSSSKPGSSCENGTDGNPNCYIDLQPYLQNLLNIMATNGMLSSTQEVLPVNKAMDDMFTQLLGAQDAHDPRARSINSVMQEVYNFGYEKSGDIVSQQFSLMQQIRNTGISMIVTCLESMQLVYTHYTYAMNDFLQKVDDTVNGSEAQAAKGLGISSAASFGGAALATLLDEKAGMLLGFVAQSQGATSQVLQAHVELALMSTTVTTMTNIGIQLMWLPLFLFVITSLITAGVQFALVIPFMPYIMFWAGQMAWVIGVIEALVAAPLVMLAFAHPGGNDYMGHAQPAVRFLIGVIFRPVLMVIGMITGILLTYVLIHYSAEGFHVIAASIFSSLPANNNMMMGVMSCLLLFSYASFLMMAFTKCFSPIYVIPEKVVQWIGGQGDRAGEAESQQFGQGVQQNAQQGAQAGGQALQQGIQAQQSRGEKMSELKKQQFEKSDMMMAGKTGQETGQATYSAAMTFKMNQNKK